MNLLKASGLIIITSLLCSCALTPQQKAAQAREHAQELLDIQVSLARECDPTAATLMSEMPNANTLTPTQRAAFDAQYNAHINNPTFQSCYNLAWKSYKEQNQLNIARMQEWDEANELNWDNGFFFDNPDNFWF